MKSHLDYIEVIGVTNASGRNRTERQWNAYYFKCYRSILEKMLVGTNRTSVLDVGTSHGNWYSFLYAQGFKRIWGVEISPARAQLARLEGYADVFNCDAADVPLPAGSIDVAVSNDVFVHIIQLADKVRVIKKIEEILAPGGCFIFNHASARAFFDNPAFRVESYCSFISLDEVIRLVHENSNLRVVDVRPSYFHWRFLKPPLALRLLRRLVALPLVPTLLAIIDTYRTRHHLPLEASDYFYVKLVKAPSSSDDD